MASMKTKLLFHMAVLCLVALPGTAACDALDPQNANNDSIHLDLVQAMREKLHGGPTNFPE